MVHVGGAVCSCGGACGWGWMSMWRDVVCDWVQLESCGDVVVSGLGVHVGVRVVCVGVHEGGAGCNSTLLCSRKEVLLFMKLLSLVRWTP